MTNWPHNFFEHPEWVAFQNAAWSDDETLIDCDAIEALLRGDADAKPLSILDVPCGEGRHALELARRGHTVTGIDFSEPLLAIARQKAKDLPVNFIAADMRFLKLSHHYDAALSFWSSFGYGSQEDDRAYFASVYSALKPGGIFIVDVLTQETLHDNLRPEVIRQSEPFVVRQANRYDATTRRLHISWHFEHRDHSHTQRCSLRIYSMKELATLLAEVGFERFDAFGDIDLLPFDSESDRLILRCHGGA